MATDATSTFSSVIDKVLSKVPYKSTLGRSQYYRDSDKEIKEGEASLL